MVYRREGWLMANNWFQDIISDYRRQLLPGELPKTMQITLWEDSDATWEAADKPWFIAEYELPLMPASGGVSGNRGQMITYGLPLEVAPTWQITLHDYDAELRDVLLTYSANRTVLRFWAWGVFVAVGRISMVQIQSPLDKVLPVTICLSGLRYLKASAHNQTVTDFDLSSTIHMLDMPFALDASSISTYQANSILYGTEMMV
jgi:hypothetical protein